MRKIWMSNVTLVEKNRLVTYGIDQEDIVLNFSYQEMIYLLLFGRKPDEVEAEMFRAVIVSHCSHGITGQSTLAVRMGVDCRSSFLNSLLAGFLVGSGPYHQGGLEAAMRELIDIGQLNDIEGHIMHRLNSRSKLIGYGHRFHSHDPRARLLMELCDKHDFNGPTVTLARKIESILLREKGIRMNIEAAGGSILLDLGFPVELASLIIIMGRAPMLAAAYMERLREGMQPFQRIEVSDLVPDKENIK